MATEQTDPKATTSPHPGQAAQITKMDAIRRAEEVLGDDAPRNKIQSFVKEQFGLELTPKYITDSRSKLRVKSKQKKPKKAATRPAVAKEATLRTQALPAPARAAAQPSKGEDAVRIEDIEAVQALVKQIGLEQLRRLIDVLGP